jgi:3-hydroxybutyryl-CoA dehydrogenase
MAAELETVGVVGAGFMGSGIAESAARAGLSVTLHEPDEAPSSARAGASSPP